MKRLALWLLTLLPAVLAHAQEPLERAVAAQDYPAAISVLDSLLATPADSVQLRKWHLQKAQLYKRLYKTGEAVALLQDMLADNDTEVLAELADAFLMQGDYLRAADQYTILSFFHPDNLFYKIRLQSLLYRLKDYPQCAALGQAVLERDSIPAVMTLVGDAFTAMRAPADSALRYYRSSFARQPSSASLLTKIAVILRGQGRHDEVMALADAYLERWPDNTQVIGQKGLAQFLKGDFQESIYTFEKALALGDDSYATYWYLGLNNFQRERLSPALDYFKKAYQIDSSDVNLVYHMAYSTGWQDYRFTDEGKQLYEKALSMMEPDPEMMAKIYNGYGIGYTREKDWKAAVGKFEEALGYKPDDPSLLVNIANGYYWLKDYARAKTYYLRYRQVGKPGSRTWRLVEEALKHCEAELFMLQTH